jgi:hypothetical protein
VTEHSDHNPKVGRNMTRRKDSALEQELLQNVAEIDSGRVAGSQGAILRYIQCKRKIIQHLARLD